ncbi:MAG TPA: nitronate monooxygenase [Gammaproteobacteria bacterium]|nr:nitronate monooxygenase [Gammaproteobacteria bacterium]
MTTTTLTTTLGIDVPLICGAMYPCSNPELVAAVSEAGAIGIIQPLSLTYVHGYDLREGLRYIRSLTRKPVGMNLIIEQSSQKYLDRVHQWTDIALEEGIRFFITALGNPRWVVDQAKPLGATIYHDVTERKWADKAFNAGVDGFICVNHRAGGHAGTLSAQTLYDSIAPLGKPLIAAGGIGNPEQFRHILAMGYAGAQLGTRFIASQECNAHNDYKHAILKATEQDIVLTEKISGIPVSVINTPYIQQTGTHAGPIAKWLLQHRKTKHWMRTLYSLQSIFKLKKSSQQGANYKDFFQAGKSVEGIKTLKTAQEIVDEFSQTGPP